MGRGPLGPVSAEVVRTMGSEKSWAREACASIEVRKVMGSKSRTWDERLGLAGRGKGTDGKRWE